jgi:hypothetical protein
MGLDMYAFTVAASVAGDTQVDLRMNDDHGNALFESTVMFYWRKFNALHGWMERLYRSKGGTKESFNCVTVRLTSNDLDMLEYDVAKGNFKPVNGFFFGAQEIYPEDLESIDNFVTKARAAIAEGNAVFYDSWW